MTTGTGSATSFRLVTYLLLVAGMALFGTATPISALVGDAFPAVLGSALRMVTAAAVLVPLYVVVRRRSGAPVLPDLDRRDWLLVVAISVVGTFGFTLLLLLGLRIVPGAVGAVVMALTPVVTAIGSVAFLGDRLDRWKVTGLVVAVLGVVAVNVAGESGTQDATTTALWVGSLLVFGAVCCEATYSLAGKQLTADLSPLAIASLASVLAGLLFAPIAVVQAIGFDWSGVSVGDWVAVVVWGAGTMGLGSVLWFRGMHRTSGTTASAFMAVMPVSALIGSYVLLGEQFVWAHAVGMAAVLAGIAAVVRSDAARR